MMKVSVFGLGYVGAVSCGCFSHDGMEVVGVDLNADKVAMINEGTAPIIEPEIGDLIASGVASGRLRATTEAEDAVLATDVSVISVGTPSNRNGSLSLDAVERVSEEIGRAIAKKSTRHLVVVRSTMLPGSVKSTVVPAIVRGSGKQLGPDFGVCYNPEFLREGRSVRDHYDPPFIVIGSWDRGDGEQAARLYDAVDAECHHASVDAVEMIKYVCNAFHALKITFANEIGLLSQACGIDSRRVMEIVCTDQKLNISPRYLTPGFAFGGSCLPKDLRALLYRARDVDLSMPLLGSILDSNSSQIDRTVERVLALRRRKIGMLGLSFKAGTDDLRESPLVRVAEALIGKGMDLKIVDENVSIARLVGANKAYIENEIPHLAALLAADLETVVDHADILIVGQNTADFRRLPTLCTPGQSVIDLVGIDDLADCDGIDYTGIAW